MRKNSMTRIGIIGMGLMGAGHAMENELRKLHDFVAESLVLSKV